MIDQAWLSTQAEALIERIKASEALYVLAIAGYPGSGKSTVSDALVNYTNKQGIQSVLLGMDAFHYTNATLEEKGICQEKGMPHTFDLGAFKQCLEQLITVRDIDQVIPVYRRDLHEPVPGAETIPAETKLLVVEGNYLLLDQPGWKALHEFWSERWWIQVTRDLASMRLLARHLKGGKTQSAAQRHIQSVDLKNMNLLDEYSISPDQLLILPGND